MPPPGALADVMDAIEGDGSLRSYIQASILRREIGELGAWWHGISWGVHTLLDNGAAPKLPQQCSETTRDGSPAFWDTEGDSVWHWHCGPPRDWRPVAERDSSAITVVFYTWTTFGQMGISRHSDSYREGSMRPIESIVAPILEGPWGIMF